MTAAVFASGAGAALLGAFTAIGLLLLELGLVAGALLGAALLVAALLEVTGLALLGAALIGAALLGADLLGADLLGKTLLEATAFLGAGTALLLAARLVGFAVPFAGATDEALVFVVLLELVLLVN